MTRQTSGNREMRFPRFLMVTVLALASTFFLNQDISAAVDIYTFSSPVTSTTSTIAPNYYVTDVSVGVQQDLDTLDISVDFAQPITPASFSYQSVGGIAGTVTPTLTVSIASADGSPINGVGNGSINMGTGTNGLWVGPGLFPQLGNSQKLDTCSVSTAYSQAFNKTLVFSFSRKCVQLPSQFMIQTQMNFYSIANSSNQYSMNNPYTPFYVDLTKVPGFKSSQSITAQNPGNPYLNQGPIHITAVNNHNLPMTYSVQASSGVCSVPDANSPYISLQGQGQCSVVISAAGNPAFDPAPPVQVIFQVLPSQVDQSITSNLPQAISLDNPQFNFSLYDSSGSQVTAVSNTPSICQLNGSNSITAYNAGTCTLTFSAASNGNFKAAVSQVNIQITPQRVTQQVYYTAPSETHVGDASFDVSLSNDSGLPIQVISDTPDVCQFNDNNDGLLVTIVGSGTCSMEVNQDGNDQYLPFSANAVTFEVLPKLATPSSKSTTPSKGAGTTPNKVAAPPKIVIHSFTNNSTTQQHATSKTSNPNVASGSSTTSTKTKSSTSTPAPKPSSPKISIKVTTPKTPVKKAPAKKTPAKKTPAKKTPAKKK